MEREWLKLPMAATRKAPAFLLAGDILRTLATLMWQVVMN